MSRTPLQLYIGCVTTTSRIQDGCRGISCAAWSRATVPESAQPTPEAVYRSSCSRCDSNLDPLTSQTDALTTRPPLRPASLQQIRHKPTQRSSGLTYRDLRSGADVRAPGGMSYITSEQRERACRRRASAASAAAAAASDGPPCSVAASHSALVAATAAATAAAAAAAVNRRLTAPARSRVARPSALPRPPLRSSINQTIRRRRANLCIVDAKRRTRCRYSRRRRLELRTVCSR